MSGERRLTESEIPWLKGYEGSKPVRVGNAAHEQLQLDVYGEVLDALFQARQAGLAPLDESWRVSRSLLDWLSKNWDQSDDGIWEIRSDRQHFVHSRVMAWVAFDRAIKGVEHGWNEGPVDEWRRVRDAIYRQVSERGFDPARNTFLQAYESDALDASLLIMPLVGFVPANDPRMQGTVAAIEKHLMHDGFVSRYDTRVTVDGLPPGEGSFLPCTFWYVDNLVLQGRHSEAIEMFERLLKLRNDVGLLSEEYESRSNRLVGNFPQAFTHVGLINTALNLAQPSSGPAGRRPGF